MENCNHEEHNSHNMIFMWKLVRKYLTVISNNHFFMINFLNFFLMEEKEDLRVTVIVPCPTVQLDKLMSTTSSNWSSKTLNPHTPQALLVSETSRNCNYSPRDNSNLRCGEISTITYQLYHTYLWLLLFFLGVENCKTTKNMIHITWYYVKLSQ